MWDEFEKICIKKNKNNRTKFLRLHSWKSDFRFLLLAIWATLGQWLFSGHFLLKWLRGKSRGPHERRQSSHEGPESWERCILSSGPVVNQQKWQNLIEIRTKISGTITLREGGGGGCVAPPTPTKCRHSKHDTSNFSWTIICHFKNQKYVIIIRLDLEYCFISLFEFKHAKEYGKISLNEWYYSETLSLTQ